MPVEDLTNGEAIKPIRTRFLLVFIVHIMVKVHDWLLTLSYLLCFVGGQKNKETCPGSHRRTLITKPANEDLGGK